MYVQKLLLMLVLLPWAANVCSQEMLNRGLAALASETGGVYLSWRLHTDDPADVAFDLYRVTGGAAQKVNDEPIVRSTNFVDVSGSLSAGDDWYIAVAGSSRASPYAVKPKNAAAGYLEFATGRTTHGRSFAVGDLLGRGQLDFVLRFSAFTADPYYSLWSKSPSRYTLTAFDQAGTSLWTYNMGYAIEMGIWYSPYLVYDLDEDGRAELVVKAGDESLTVEQMRDESGRIMYGPEYVRVISGEDGNTVLAQADWPDRTGFSGADAPGTPLANRKYEDYNRWSRNFMAIAYLDGVHPHLIVSRGTYGKHKTAAYRYRNGQLNQVWYWENQHPAEGGERAHWGQGAHSLQAHDVDGDGKDEVILGGLVLSNEGKPLWSLARGHVDHVYVGDFDPGRAGKEFYYGAESGYSANGIGMLDANSGLRLWGVEWPTTHIHREGLCADIDPTSAGTECYSGEENGSAQWTFSATGNVLSQQNLGGLRPYSAFWDGSPQKSIFAGTGTLSDGVFREARQFPDLTPVAQLPLPYDIASNDLQYVKPVAVMDLLGDWREELVAVDRNRLLVYMSNKPAATRHPWLMQDHAYRLGVASASLGYYQQPMLSYDMANQMRTPGFSLPDAAGGTSSNSSSSSSSSSSASSSSSSSSGAVLESSIPAEDSSPAPKKKSGGSLKKWGLLSMLILHPLSSHWLWEAAATLMNALARALGYTSKNS